MTIPDDPDDLEPFQQPGRFFTFDKDFAEFSSYVQSGRLCRLDEPLYVFFLSQGELFYEGEALFLHDGTPQIVDFATGEPGSFLTAFWIADGGQFFARLTQHPHPHT